MKIGIDFNGGIYKIRTTEVIKYPDGLGPHCQDIKFTFMQKFSVSRMNKTSQNFQNRDSSVSLHSFF